MESTTATKAEDEERIHRPTVVGSNTTILDCEAEGGNISVTNDIPLVQQHKTETATTTAAISAAPRPSCETVRTKSLSKNEGDKSVADTSISTSAIEPTAKLGDGSSQSSLIPELPSTPTNRYTKAQLLELRPEGSTQQQFVAPIWRRKFDQANKSIESSHPTEDREGWKNDRFKKYSGDCGQQGGRTHHGQRYSHGSNSGGKPKEGERCNRSMEQYFGKGILGQPQHQGGNENHGSMTNNSSLPHSTSSSVTKCSDDFESLTVTENRCV